MTTGYEKMMGAPSVADLVKRVTGYATASMDFINENIELENPLGAYFPFVPTKLARMEMWTRQGAGGVMGVSRSAAIPATKPLLRRWEKEIDTDKYAYTLTNKAIEDAFDDLAGQDALDANIFFAAARYWKQVTALVAGAGKSIASGGTWESTSAESSIVEALTYLDDMGYNPNWGPRLVVYPARAGAGILQARSIRGGMDSTANVIKSSFPDVRFIPNSPFRAMNNELTIDILAGSDSDALSTNALVVVGNAARVMDCKEYTFQKTPNVFVDVTADYGYTTILHRANDVMIRKLRSTSSSATTNPLIVKITGAAAAR